MRTTTLVTFLFQCPTKVRTVELLGSWDNFSRPYLMEKDERRGRGNWKGCYRFSDIICDGNLVHPTEKRSGGLKMGGTYWYFYRLDGDAEDYDVSQPSTTSCPLLPGQPMNILEVPYENQGRTASICSDISFASVPSGIHTLDPQDRYISPQATTLPEILPLALPWGVSRTNLGQYQADLLSVSPSDCAIHSSGSDMTKYTNSSVHTPMDQVEPEPSSPISALIASLSQLKANLKTHPKKARHDRSKSYPTTLLRKARKLSLSRRSSSGAHELLVNFSEINNTTVSTAAQEDVLIEDAHHPFLPISLSLRLLPRKLRNRSKSAPECRLPPKELLALQIPIGWAAEEGDNEEDPPSSSPYSPTTDSPLQHKSTSFPHRFNTYHQPSLSLGRHSHLFEEEAQRSEHGAHDVCRPLFLHSPISEEFSSFEELQNRASMTNDISFCGSPLGSHLPELSSWPAQMAAELPSEQSWFDMLELQNSLMDDPHPLSPASCGRDSLSTSCLLQSPGLRSLSPIDQLAASFSDGSPLEFELSHHGTEVNRGNFSLASSVGDIGEPSTPDLWTMFINDVDSRPSTSLSHRHPHHHDLDIGPVDGSSLHHRDTLVPDRKKNTAVSRLTTHSNGSESVVADTIIQVNQLMDEFAYLGEALA